VCHERLVIEQYSKPKTEPAILVLIEPQFRTKFGDTIWDITGRIARMAAFEGALASAQAATGLIPETSAKSIVRVCKTALPEANDLYEKAKVAGNPAIPFLNYLTTAVASEDSNAAAHVHFGATSQDLIDSANMMALAEIADALDSMLLEVASDLRKLAIAHTETPMVARTLLQQATPITFGLKAALWGIAITQTRKQLKAARCNDMAVQLGGSNGTLSAMAPHGPAVRADTAARLGLTDPDHCWHVLRGRILTISTTFAALVGAAAKISGDCILMMQTEVGELQEASPGGSSAMPQKKNPVDALVPIAALPLAATHLSAMTASQMHAHERAAGPWHSEWITLPVLTSLTLASIESLMGMLSGLKINTSQMKANLARTGGTLAAEELAATLVESVGRNEAHNLIRTLVEQSDYENFADTIRSNTKLSGLIPESRLSEILSYKGPLAAAAQEAQKLVNKSQ